MKKNIKIISLVIFCLAVFGGFSYASAADLPSWLTNPLSSFSAPVGAFKDVSTGLTTVINGIITVVEVIFIILFLIGGVMYLTSAGNEDSAKKARTLLLSAVIGLVITFAAWPVSTWVLERISSGSTTPLITTSPGGSGYSTTTANPTAGLPTTNPADEGLTDKQKCLKKCSTNYENAALTCLNKYQLDDQSYKQCIENATTNRDNCIQKCSDGELSPI